jgi:hypothetical protein
LASTLGEAEVTTPLLGEALQGSVYLAQPACGGAGHEVAGMGGRETPGGRESCTEAAAEAGGLFALYLEAGSETSGVYIKLEGKVEVGGEGSEGKHNDLQPGQVRITFAEMPQEPIGELRLSFHGGPRALLANPQSCGSFATEGALEPWSHQPAPGEAEGTPNVTLQPAFTISGCEDRFAPALAAGTTNNQAGAYSPFTLTFSRQDREQDLAGVSLTTPPGLLANLASVPLCAEPQAAQGTCVQASEVGTASVAAGAGSEPLYLSGHVFLTGPYNGEPFGLAIVVPAQAGPFALGEIVVRASIAVDPATAALTIASDSLPQSIDGVPLRLQTVNVTLNREGFILNPTDCNPLTVNGTIASNEGAAAAVSSHFQVAGCAKLPFKPAFTAATGARTSQANGASLAVKLTFPSDRSSGIGQQANIKSVKIDLPKQLPSRLTTLQQACLAKTFEANPAGCPAASVIGHVQVSTPILPGTGTGASGGLPGAVPGASGGVLSGPAYFVSHGSETFPSLELVLQGDGVEIDLVGTTFINKKGITSVTFRTIPDVPVNTFTLALPEGPYSALGTNKNLCRYTGKLRMPTALTGQNGAAIHESTKVSVSGCPPTRRKASKAKRKKRHAKTHAGQSTTR